MCVEAWRRVAVQQGEIVGLFLIVLCFAPRHFLLAMVPETTVPGAGEIHARRTAGHGTVRIFTKPIGAAVRADDARAFVHALHQERALPHMPTGHGGEIRHRLLGLHKKAVKVQDVRYKRVSL